MNSSFLFTNKLSKFFLNNINHSYNIKNNKLFYCSSIPSASNTIIPTSSSSASTSTIINNESIIDNNNNNNNNNSNSSLSSSTLNNLKHHQQTTFEPLKDILKENQIEEINKQFNYNKEEIINNNNNNNKKKLINSEKEINSLLYSNQDFQSIIKLFNSTYTASTEFLVENNLDPLLLKTSKPDEPVKVKNRYVLVGLGNPGDKYEDTRHNVGFKVIDRICELFNIRIDQKNKHSEYTTLYLRLDDRQEKKRLMEESKKKRIESQNEIKFQFMEYLLKQQQQHQQIDNINQLLNLTLEQKLMVLLNNNNNNNNKDFKDTMNEFKNQFEINFKQQQQSSSSSSSKLNNSNNTIKPKKIIKQIILLKPQTFMNRSGGSVRNISSEFNVPSENVLVFHDEITSNVGEVKMKANGGSANHNGVQDVIDRLGTQKFARFRIGVGPKNNEPTSIFVLKRIPDEKTPKLKSAIEKASRYSIMWLETGTKDFIELNLD